MRDCNGDRVAYGFVSAGDIWKVITYDGEVSTMLKQIIDVVAEWIKKRRNG